MTSVTDPTKARTRRRLKLFQPTTMRLRAELVRVHLLDLSATGAMVHAETPPAVNDRVRIECDGAMRPAKVVWVEGRRFGIAFTPALSEETVAATVASRAAEVAIASARIGPLRR